jgi:hypothetical protein
MQAYPDANADVRKAMQQGRVSAASPRIALIRV